MVVGYFDNSTGLFVGDDVRIRGVNVGRVVDIQPEPLRTKITFWFDPVQGSRRCQGRDPFTPTRHRPRDTTDTALHRWSDHDRWCGHPAGPNRGTGRVGRYPGPTRALDRHAATHQTRWGEHTGRIDQLGSRQPRRAGASIRDTVVKLSQTVAVLNEHSSDVFGTVKNLSTLVSGLRDSSDLLAQLNVNLAAVSGLLADDPNKVSRAVEDLNGVVGDVQSFVAENREPIGTASQRLQSITDALTASLDDIKETLHTAPNTLVNFNNIYEPANGSLTGTLQVNNFANPISFLCGAIQAASRMAPTRPPNSACSTWHPSSRTGSTTSPVGREPLRRRPGPTQRGHLQRGLDAPGLYSTATEFDYATGPRTAARRGGSTRTGRHGSRGGPVGDDDTVGGWLMNHRWVRRLVAGVAATAMLVMVSGCGWRVSFVAATRNAG